MIKGKKGEICLNGAAARLVHKGDLVIIASFCQIEVKQAEKHKPTVVLLGEGNKIKSMDGK